jgi:hypothetical protein
MVGCGPRSGAFVSSAMLLAKTWRVKHKAVLVSISAQIDFEAGNLMRNDGEPSCDSLCILK